MVYFYAIKKTRALVAGIRKDRTARFRAVGLPGRFYLKGVNHEYSYHLQQMRTHDHRIGRRL